MRMNLPAEYRATVTKVLGDIPFSFYHRFFDIVFVCSAVATMFMVGTSYASIQTKLTD